MTDAVSDFPQLERKAQLSLFLLFIMVNVLITTLVFQHEHNVKFPPLIESSPCSLPKVALQRFSFAAFRNEYREVVSGESAITCEYYRDGYTFEGKFKRDEIFISRLSIPQTLPDVFLRKNPAYPHAYYDRVIIGNRDIREACGLDNDCVAYIEPNILLRVIYRTGGTCHQDAMLLARYFIHDQSIYNN